MNYMVRKQYVYGTVFVNLVRVRVRVNLGFQGTGTDVYAVRGMVGRQKDNVLYVKNKSRKLKI